MGGRRGFHSVERGDDVENPTKTEIAFIGTGNASGHAGEYLTEFVVPFLWRNSE